MSGFMKKTSKLVQNVFAWLPAVADSQATVALQNPGKATVKQGSMWQRAQDAGCQLVPNWAPKTLTKGVGWVTEGDILGWKTGHFLSRTTMANHTLQP